MKKNENEKVTITVSSRPNDMRGWFEEKSGRILEELSFLADTLHRPGDAPAGGWPTKQEEADFHLSQTVLFADCLQMIFLPPWARLPVVCIMEAWKEVSAYDKK